MVDECEAPSRAASKLREAELEGASTFDQAEDDQSNVDERDLFLEALLEPNEHAQRLLEVRNRVIYLCRIYDILSGVCVPVQETLRSVVASCALLKEAGLMQDSLVLLADDPERLGVVQAVEIAVDYIEALPRTYRGTHSSHGVTRGSVSHDEMYQASQKLLGMLGLMDRSVEPLSLLDLGRDEQIHTFGTYLALATAAYAGSHCHAFWPQESLRELGSLNTEVTEFSIVNCKMRTCHFACLYDHIGGPVWVFGRARQRDDMILSITKEQFDDLWGPVIALVDPSNEQALAFQTEGGFLSKAIPCRGSPLARENETEIHWTPALPGCRSLPLGISLDSFFDLNATMLIGFGGQDDGSSRLQENRIVSGCFRTNHGCKLDAKSHQLSIEACRLEYVGTLSRQWTVDTKAVNLAVGWSGSSIGTNRTWKLRPATTWKGAMLLYCARPARDIAPLMLPWRGFCTIGEILAARCRGQDNRAAARSTHTHRALRSESKHRTFCRGLYHGCLGEW